jgi:hypothetical protein
MKHPTATFPEILLREPKTLRKHRRGLKRKAPLTVCIAAICNYGGAIFGACDRMMTSADIEFEPRLEDPAANQSTAFSSNPKIFRVSSSIIMMTAGDSGLQAEIMAGASAEINGRIGSNPTKWLPVKEAVDCYVNAYNSAKNKRVLNDVLVPFGLDKDSFLGRQSEMSPEFVLDLNRRILKSDLDFRELYSVHTIVTGNEEAGPHIYTVAGDFCDLPRLNRYCGYRNRGD